MKIPVFRTAGGEAVPGDIRAVRIAGVFGGGGICRVPIHRGGPGAHLLRCGADGGNDPRRRGGGPVHAGPDAGSGRGLDQKVSGFRSGRDHRSQHRHGGAGAAGRCAWCRFAPEGTRGACPASAPIATAGEARSTTRSPIGRWRSFPWWSPPRGCATSLRSWLCRGSRRCSWDRSICRWPWAGAAISRMSRCAGRCWI